MGHAWCLAQPGQGDPSKPHPQISRPSPAQGTAGILAPFTEGSSRPNVPIRKRSSAGMVGRKVGQPSWEESEKCAEFVFLPWDLSHVHTEDSHLRLASKVRSELSKGSSTKNWSVTGINTTGQPAGLPLTEFLGAGTPGSHPCTQCSLVCRCNPQPELRASTVELAEKAGLGGSCCVQCCCC